MQVEWSISGLGEAAQPPNSGSQSQTQGKDCGLQLMRQGQGVPSSPSTLGSGGVAPQPAAHSQSVLSWLQFGGRVPSESLVQRPWLPDRQVQLPSLAGHSVEHVPWPGGGGRMAASDRAREGDLAREAFSRFFDFRGEGFRAFAVPVLRRI